MSFRVANEPPAVSKNGFFDKLLRSTMANNTPTPPPSASEPPSKDTDKAAIEQMSTLVLDAYIEEMAQGEQSASPDYDWSSKRRFQMEDADANSEAENLEFLKKLQLQQGGMKAAPKTFPPSKEAVRETLQHNFGDPVAPEKLTD